LHLRFSSFIAVTLLILFAAPQLARAAATSATSQGCGTTVEDNLAAARQALQSSNGNQRAALACLIEATAGLNVKLHEYETGKSGAQEWHPPITDFPVKPGQ
jgi:hypothetical protein